MALGSDTVTIINNGEPTGYDGVGDPIYGAQTATVVTGCSLQLHVTKRDINVTDTVTSRSRLFAPPCAPITATSIVVEGVATLPLPEPLPEEMDLYLVDGDIAIWETKSGRVTHIECYLRAQSG
jgi:hypothetical protein